MGRHRLTQCAALLVSLACFALSGGEAAAGDSPDSYYEGKEEGWFWREIPFTTEESLKAKEAEPPVLPSEMAPEVSALMPAPLSPAWLREKLPELRDRALEDPSPENVKAYFYLQRYAMDLAQRFALAAQKVVLSDPALDENTRRPISSYGGQVFDEVARTNRIRIASKIADMAGVWYFFRSDCPYCRAQNPILQRLQSRIGLAVLPIALDGRPMPEASFVRFVVDRGHAQLLGVTQTPTLYLVRKPNEFVLLSEGLLTDDALLERMVLAAHEAGWISDEEYDSTRATRTPEVLVDAQSLGEGSLDDPSRLVEVLRMAGAR